MSKIEQGANVLNAKAHKLKLWSKDEIKSDQDVIRGNLLNIDKAIHANAIQCLLHCETHGDTSLMTRLLVDIVDAKTGYRRQGLINWMRKFSPMELVQNKTINLSGTMTAAGIASLKKQFPEVDAATFGIPGAKRPFMLELANATPFWTDSDNNEQVSKPVYQSTALGKVDQMYKEIKAAIDNTVDGKPIDVTKPFYDGIHKAEILDFAEKVKAMREALPADATKEVRDTQARIQRDTDFVTANATAAA